MQKMPTWSLSHVHLCHTYRISFLSAHASLGDMMLTDCLPNGDKCDRLPAGPVEDVVAAHRHRHLLSLKRGRQRAAVRSRLSLLLWRQAGAMSHPVKSDFQSRSEMLLLTR